MISLIISVILLATLTFYLLWKFSPELPSYDKIVNYKPSLSSRIYSSDGFLLKSFYTQERIFIPIERIPKKIIYAFISAEDKKFYNHIGIDFIAISRAIITNILSYSKNTRVVGASTITQQVVKNLLLSNEISYQRKIKEIILALRIENILRKNDIMELYLNDIYLGFGSYGIGTASLNYFNKSIYELDLSEIAFLAALPKAPNNYNPISKYKNAIERRNWVLDRMFKNGYIDKENLEYKRKPIKISNRKENSFIEANYFYEEIRKKLYNKYGKEKLYQEGLIVKTTINSKIQKYANQSLLEGIIDYEKRLGWVGTIHNINKQKFIENENFYKKINPFYKSWKPVIITNINNNKIFAEDHKSNKIEINLINEENKWVNINNFTVGDVIFVQNKNNELILRQIPKVNGAIIVLNPHNGDILGLSGGVSYKLSEFNRATQAKRQPGSAFKPFVYLAALKEGYTPSTLILDAPYVVDQGPGLPKWKPANYTDEFYGLTTMRTGIEKSRNLMTVRLADKIGMNKIIDVANSFGLKNNISEQLSMSLGSGLVTLSNITNAYGIIANGGIKTEPTIIKSIYSKDGKNIFNNNMKKCINCILEKIDNNYNFPEFEYFHKRIVDAKITYQITSMMEGVVKRGTGKKLKDLEVPIAGKTGTTNDNKDAWFIGFTPNLVVGVYVGYDNPKTLGYKQTGSSVAVPIFKKFAKKININENKIPFRVPSGISFVRIDPKTGQSSAKINSILEPYILGTEPYNSNINVIDNLSSIKNNSISGTGGLLE